MFIVSLGQPACGGTSTRKTKRRRALASLTIANAGVANLNTFITLTIQEIVETPLLQGVFFNEKTFVNNSDCQKALSASGGCCFCSGSFERSASA